MPAIGSFAEPTKMTHLYLGAFIFTLEWWCLSLVPPPAVDEVGGPTILATFTVIAALLPMAFVSGLMGPYMSPIPINASIGMLLSLAVALIITPWASLKLLRPHAAEESGSDTWLDRLFRRIVTPFLGGAAGRRPRRWLRLGRAGVP